MMLGKNRDARPNCLPFAIVSPSRCRFWSCRAFHFSLRGHMRSSRVTHLDESDETYYGAEVLYCGELISSVFVKLVNMQILHLHVIDVLRTHTDNLRLRSGLFYEELGRGLRHPLLETIPSKVENLAVGGSHVTHKT